MLAVSLQALTPSNLSRLSGREAFLLVDKQGKKFTSIKNTYVSMHDFPFQFSVKLASESGSHATANSDGVHDEMIVL